MQKSFIIILITLIITSVITVILINLDDKTKYQSSSPPKKIIKEEIVPKDFTTDIPIKEFPSRIIKKPFGIKIDPKTSPVQPERFSGFHTGTDFEIFEDEINVDIKIRAICNGDIIQRTSVNGYGGVIVQKCRYQNDSILILYGHINPETFTEKIKIEEGNVIASLSSINSPQSGFERKHLHIGIIKGEKIDYRGYVQSKNELEKWIDPEKFIK